METTGIIGWLYSGYIGIIGYILGLYWDNGIMEKKMETTISGLGFRGNGKDNENYFFIWGYMVVYRL